LWKNGHRKDCGLYFHSESYGWEVQSEVEGRMTHPAMIIGSAATLAHEAAAHGTRGDGQPAGNVRYARV
jgi:hypothetical protein